MMAKQTDMRCRDAKVYFLPIEMRLPLKFGLETVTHVTCARACVMVERPDGTVAQGWGETPLAATWVWPSSLSYEERDTAMRDFCATICGAWRSVSISGHPMEIGHAFLLSRLPGLLEDFNRARPTAEPMPWLGALVCLSAFDIALHDAYGILNDVPVYETYNVRFMNSDLSAYIKPAENTDVSFQGKYPEHYFVKPRLNALPAWHLVGGVDIIDRSELTGSEPDDGYPVLLDNWIMQDGLTCLKVKLRGNDSEWDYNRLVKIGKIAIERGALWLTSDFNCTVTDPDYVNAILDRLLAEEPRIYGMVLYVEQPFPYDLETNRIDVHSVSARKPLFMDESAHDWQLVRLGRGLGWTGVALKTCKTQTGALLSLCWAKAHGMTIMVQDLTNPMLAQIPHVLLASYAGTIMGVETNSMQFYPEASVSEARIHPAVYRRRDGMISLGTLKGPGFGYCLGRMDRQLPEPAVDFKSSC